METANLETGAAEQAPDSSSFDDKLAAKLGFGTETAEPTEQPAAPEATADVPEGELSADDVAGDRPQGRKAPRLERGSQAPCSTRLGLLHSGRAVKGGGGIADAAKGCGNGEGSTDASGRGSSG